MPVYGSEMVAAFTSNPALPSKCYDCQRSIIAHRIKIEMVRVLDLNKNTEYRTEFSLVWNA